MSNRDKIPQVLKDQSRWLAWRPSRGKKVPIGNDGYALAAWKSDPLTYEAACKRADDWDQAELGFLHGGGWGGIDLDDCVMSDGGIDPRAQIVVDRAQAYTERSPSGKGLKIFGRSSGWLELNFSDAARVHVARKPDLYFAVTGDVYLDAPADVDLEPTIELVCTTMGDEALLTKERQEKKIPDVIPRGTQNDTLFREACRHRAMGKSEEEIFGILKVLRHRCVPPPSDSDLREIARSAGRYAEGEVDEFPLTESGDAEHFAALNANHLRYDHRRARWLLYDGVRWRPQSDGEVDRLALLAIRDRQKRSQGSKDRLRWAVGGESRSRRANMLALAQTTLPLADGGENWDADPYLMGVQNGVLDLRTGNLRPGQWEDRITMQAPVSYDPEAKCPTWEWFVEDIFKHDPKLVPFVHKALGYSMTGDCKEEAFFLCSGEGHGRNGKGTLINTVSKVLGEYWDNLSFHSLERGVNGARESTNDIAKLYHRRFVTASETNIGARFDESRIKTITGRDPVTARFLYKEEFTFVPEFKLWLSVNHPPKVRDDSSGFWSRPRLIPFLQRYEGREDLTLKDRLESELPGILAWMVRGCLLWQKEGLGAPESVKMAVQQYRTSEDILAEFYEECCVMNEGARERPSALFGAYIRHCDRNRVRARLGMKGFSQQLAKRFKRVAVNGNAYYNGIGLMQETAEATDGRMLEI